MKFRDLEDLVNLGIDAAELELGLELRGLFVELHEFPQRRRSHEFDRREVEDNSVFIGFAERGIDVVKQSCELCGIDEAIVLNADGKDAVFTRGLNGHGTIRFEMVVE